jgi:hypothetical protein
MNECGVGNAEWGMLEIESVIFSGDLYRFFCDEESAIF